MLRALTTFHACGRLITIGELVEASDPIVKGREALFAQDDSTPVVEQATAAPGEKRRARRAPAAKVADKPAED